MPASLSREDRLRLMKFVCSFAWADLDVNSAERRFVERLVRRLHLPDEERSEVAVMLEIPPRAEDIDPLEVPYEHRVLFVKTVKDLLLADGSVDPAEAENLDLFEQLLEM